MVPVHRPGTIPPPSASVLKVFNDVRGGLLLDPARTLPWSGKGVRSFLACKVTICRVCRRDDDGFPLQFGPLDSSLPRLCSLGFPKIYELFGGWDLGFVDLLDLPCFIYKALVWQDHCPDDPFHDQTTTGWFQRQRDRDTLSGRWGGRRRSSLKTMMYFLYFSRGVGAGDLINMFEAFS